MWFSLYTLKHVHLLLTVMFREMLAVDCIISYKLHMLFAGLPGVSENIFVQLPFQTAEILKSLQLALRNLSEAES